MTEAGIRMKSCPRCGASLSCGAKAGSCWCAELPAVPVVDPATDCLCRACLTAELAGNTDAMLLEGRDFYREGAAIVFTAAYHLRRGFCCGSGCRHCPYHVAEARP